MKIVTVHGTFAGAREDEGERWWQRDSEFSNALAKDVGVAAEDILPFHWQNGENSEVLRTQSGKKLFYFLSSLTDDYVVVSHSHGSNVVFHALLYAIYREHPLRNLKRWVSVGAPFLNFGKKALIRRTFSITLKPLIYAWAVLVVTGIVSVVGGVVTESSKMEFYVSALLAMSLIGAVSYKIFKTGDRHFRSIGLSPLLEQKLSSIFHSADEAFFALSQVKDRNIRLASERRISAFISNIIGYAAILSIVMISIMQYKNPESYLSYYWLYKYGRVAVLAILIILPEWIVSPLVFFDNNWGVLLGIVAHLLVFIFAYLAIFAFLITVFFAAYVISVPINWLASRAFSTQLRNLILGWDVADRYITSVTRKPDSFSEATEVPIDPKTEEQMMKSCDKALLSSSQAVRQMLMAVNLGEITAEQGQELVERQGFKALIHNSYFDSPGVRKLILDEIKRGLERRAT